MHGVVHGAVPRIQLQSCLRATTAEITRHRRRANGRYVKLISDKTLRLGVYKLTVSCGVRRPNCPSASLSASHSERLQLLIEAQVLLGPCVLDAIHLQELQ